MPLWIRVLILAASLKLVLSPLGFMFGSASGYFPAWVYLVHVVAFGLPACFLLAGSRSDERANHLGVIFLLVASTFSTRLAVGLAEHPEVDSPALQLYAQLQFNAFLPVFYWLFVRHFPTRTPYGAARKVESFALSISLAASVLLFVANTLAAGSTANGSTASWVPESLLVTNERTVYWLIQYSLILSALVFAGWKAKNARIAEKRRFVLFVSALLVGGFPILLVNMLDALSPRVGQFLLDDRARYLVGIVVYPFLLSIPFTTAYAVLIDHVLDVRLVVRKALQYALAKFTITALALAPLILAVYYLYLNRSKTVEELLSGRYVYVLGLGLLVGAMTFKSRDAAFRFVDRIFFRDQYDAQRVLSALVLKSIGIGRVDQLSALLRQEINRALHLSAVHFYVLDDANAVFLNLDGDTRPLSTATSVVAMLSADKRPISVDLDDPLSGLRSLAEEERFWLAEVEAEMLVPIISSNGLLVAFLALGTKRSELPYSREDRELLKAVASSAAVSMDRSDAVSGLLSRAKTVAQHAVSQEELAKECLRCGTVYPAGSLECAECESGLRTSHVPHFLFGKFKLQARVGAGAMGVVYRALDVTLERDVAIKTLPKVSPEHAMRLRREARAMASLQHPNLAVIHGAEFWNAVPMLILEFLDGGTLSRRIETSGPLSVEEALDMGIVLADVLEHIHGTGILHRDVKPSNIGFARDGSPKLLDFGLSHILWDTRHVRGGIRIRENSENSTPGMDASGSLDFSMNSYIVGTPAYLSPEALAGEQPTQTFDLWGLALVMYEALVGTNPCLGGSLSETLEQVRSPRIPDVNLFRPRVPDEVVVLFRSLLARVPARRPSTAAEFRAMVRSVRAAVLDGARARPVTR